MDPYLLLALLSSPLVKSQIFAKRFTQDIIDTLGGRWAELILPVSKDATRRKEIIDSVKKSILLRREASELSWQAVYTPHPALTTSCVQQHTKPRIGWMFAWFGTPPTPEPDEHFTQLLVPGHPTHPGWERATLLSVLLGAA